MFNQSFPTMTLEDALFGILTDNSFGWEKKKHYQKNLVYNDLIYAIFYKDIRYISPNTIHSILWYHPIEQVLSVKRRFVLEKWIEYNSVHWHNIPFLPFLSDGQKKSLFSILVDNCFAYELKTPHTRNVIYDEILKAILYNDLNFITLNTIYSILTYHPLDKDEKFHRNRVLNLYFRYYSVF